MSFVDNHKISVIIPAFNRENTVKDAIESVFAQDYGNIEIIVCDDGSDLDLSAFLAHYRPRIKVIRSDINNGVSAARNAGVRAAGGDYIAFLDSDDLWLKNKLSVQLAQMNHDNCKVSHTDEFWYKSDRFINSGKQHTKYGGYIFGYILDKCRVSPSSFIIEKNIYDSFNGFDESLRVCEDYSFFIRLASKYNFSFCPAKLIIKRAICDNSLSGGINHIESIRLKILDKLIKENTFTEEQKSLLCNELQRKRHIVKI